MIRKWIEVEARLDAAGNLRPAAFTYDGHRILVTSYGRQWESEGARHYLVMDQHSRVYELAYDLVNKRWEVIRSPDRPGPQRSQAA